MRRGKKLHKFFLHLMKLLVCFLHSHQASHVWHYNRSMKENTSKEFICHPRYVLCVYVVGELFVVLKTDNTDIENFIEALIMQISVDSREDEKKSSVRT